MSNREIRTEEEIRRTWQSSAPLVSICCITYNHEQYIEEALDSFLMQVTTFPIEVLIHDDASTDATAEIIKKYEARYPRIIKPIYQSENQHSIGVRINPIFNLPRATGAYLAMCEGDDYWCDPLKLQKQVDFMETHSEYTVCFHNSFNLDTHGNKVMFSNIAEAQDYGLEDLLERNLANTCTALYRNLHIRLPEKLTDIAFGDWTVHLLHAEHGKIRYLPDVMSVYRIHDTGVWSQRDRIDRVVKTVDMMQKMDRYFEGKYHFQISKTIAKFNMYIAYEHIRNNDFKTAKIFYDRAKAAGMVSFSRATKIHLKMLGRILAGMFSRHSGS